MVDLRWQRPINQVSISGDKMCDYLSRTVRDAPNRARHLSRFLLSFEDGKKSAGQRDSSDAQIHHRILVEVIDEVIS